MKFLKVEVSGFWKDFNTENSTIFKILKDESPWPLHFVESGGDLLIFSVFGQPSFWVKRIRKYLPFKNRFWAFPQPKLNHSQRAIFYLGEAADYSLSNFHGLMITCGSSQDENHIRFPTYWMDEHDWIEKSNKAHLDFKNNKPSRFCNFLYSHDRPERNSFLKRLSLYKTVDCPGRSQNNMNIPAELANRESLLWRATKIDWLRNYKFTVAFENARMPGYTSEKLLDPMLAGSIPIYWGNPEVGKEFNLRRFINCTDTSNWNEVIERIQEIDQNPKLFQDILAEPIWADGFDPKSLELRFRRKIKTTLNEWFSDRL